MKPNDFTSQNAGKAIRTQTGYWAFIPNPLPPKLNFTLPLVTAVANAERDLSRLAALVGAFPFPRLLTQPFIRNEAVLSSRIEGTRATLLDVYSYETAQLSFFERTDDVREVYNYVRAMDYALERLKTLPVSLRLIREIHEKLLENVRGGSLTPGEFRRSQNWIGPAGSTIETAPYLPPPVEDMYLALSDLEKYINTDRETPALVRAGLVHYQFEAIHPFLDGNGRVGRLLIVLLLCEWELLPQPMLNLSVYIERYRQEYYDLLLNVSHSGAWEEWLLFFLRGISEQSRDSVLRMDRLQEIRGKYQILAEKDRKPDRMSMILDFLFSRPVFSIRQAADAVGIPFKAAKDYIEKLQQAGVLREVTGYTRNRVFQADEVLKAVQGEE